MIHEDGIEVYLKPHGVEKEDIKFAEFPLRDLEKFDGPREERYKRCLVLAQEGNFDVVVRCLPHFKMYSATAVSIVYEEGTYSRRPERGFITQRSMIFEQKVQTYNSFGRNGEQIFRRRLRMVDASKAINGDFDGQRVSRLINIPGSVRVILRRSNPTWRDRTEATMNANRLYGPREPTDLRQYVPGKTKRLRGTNGKEYHFEFRYRSEDCIRQAQQAQSDIGNGTVPLPPITEIALIKDADFHRIREQDKADRKSMSGAFQKRQAMIANAHPATTDTTKQRSEQNQKPKVRRQNPNPEFCDCPDPSHNHPKLKAISTKTTKPRLGLPRVPKVQEPDEEEPPGTPQLGPIREEGDSAGSSAPVCLKCKKFKVANYKRPAFLRKWYAEADDDQDDDEVSQEPKPETEEEHTENGSEPALSAHTASVEPDNGVIGQSRDSAMGLSKSTSPFSVSDDNQHQQPAEEAIAVTTTETTSPVLNQEQTPSIAGLSTSSVEAPTTTQAGRAEAPEGVAVAQDQATDEPPPHLDYTRADSVIPQPLAEKRAACTTIEQQPPKKPRIEVDLTIDDDDNIVVIKEERKTKTDVKRQLDSIQGADEDELQAQLVEISRQRRELELDRQEAEIQRRLQSMRKKKPAGPAIKSEDIIKIED